MAFRKILKHGFFITNHKCRIINNFRKEMLFPSALSLSPCYTMAQVEVTRWEGVGGVDLKIFNSRNKIGLLLPL